MAKVFPALDHAMREFIRVSIFSLWRPRPRIRELTCRRAARVNFECSTTTPFAGSILRAAATRRPRICAPTDD